MTTLNGDPVSLSLQAKVLNVHIHLMQPTQMTKSAAVGKIRFYNDGSLSTSRTLLGKQPNCITEYLNKQSFCVVQCSTVTIYCSSRVDDPTQAPKSLLLCSLNQLQQKQLTPLLLWHWLVWLLPLYSDDTYKM